MTDETTKKILESMRELRRAEPAADEMRNALERADVALHPIRQLSPIARWIAFGAIGAAASAAVVLLAVNRMADVPKPAPMPAVLPHDPSAAMSRLRLAVERSNDYSGVVEVQYSPRATAPSDHAPSDPAPSDQAATQQAPLDRAQPAGDRESRALEMRRLLIERQRAQQRITATQPSTRPATGPAGALIPIRWDGVQNVPLPLTWSNGAVRPLVIRPGGSVRLTEESGQEVFQVQPADIAPESMGQRGIVWVNPKTGLVEKVELPSPDADSAATQQVIYNYFNPQANPTGNAAPAPNAIPRP